MVDFTMKDVGLGTGCEFAAGRDAGLDGAGAGSAGGALVAWSIVIVFLVGEELLVGGGRRWRRA